MKDNRPALCAAVPILALLPAVISPLALTPKAQAAAPKGIRLKVRCYFIVTNAIDGTRDEEAEVYGNLKFNGVTKWKVDRASAFPAVRDLNKKIEAGEQTFDVMFNRSSSSVVKIDGFLKDRDESGGDDPMWNPMKRTISLNIKTLYDHGAQRRLNGVYTSRGDRDRESAELIIIVSKAGDIF